MDQRINGRKDVGLVDGSVDRWTGEYRGGWMDQWINGRGDIGLVI